MEPLSEMENGHNALVNEEELAALAEEQETHPFNICTVRYPLLIPLNLIKLDYVWLALYHLLTPCLCILFGGEELDFL